MSEHEETEALMQKYADGLASRVDCERLQAALRGDPALRSTFLQYVYLDAALERAAAGRAPAGLKVIPMPRCRLQPLAWGAWAVAAAAALVLGLFLLSSHEPVRMEVLRSQDGLLAGRGAPLQAGERLALGQVQLSSGSVTVRLHSGVTLELCAPLEGVFESAMRLRLTRGRLNADVGERGKGFTVVTKAGELVDLGTKFGVDVALDGHTAVAVFSGQVNVNASHSTSGDRSPVLLSKGEALQLQEREEPARLSSLRLQRDENALEPGEMRSAVASAWDNVRAKDFLRFYGLVAQGMGEGAPAYTDRAYTKWHAEEGAEFPPELRGADIVRTFQFDRRRADYQLTLELARPAVVYVLFDVRKAAPEWLARTFSETGLRLRSGPWPAGGPVSQAVAPDALGRYYIVHRVWRKEFAHAGPIQLGPPQGQDQTGFKTMYGIAIKPLSPEASTMKATGPTASLANFRDDESKPNPMQFPPHDP